MRIRYFVDTDTTLIDFSEKTATETKEISENIYIDLDDAGNLVSMTIEHAKETGAPGQTAGEVEAAAQLSSSLDGPEFRPRRPERSSDR